MDSRKRTQDADELFLGNYSEGVTDHVLDRICIQSDRYPGFIAKNFPVNSILKLCYCFEIVSPKKAKKNSIRKKSNFAPNSYIYITRPTIQALKLLLENIHALGRAKPYVMEVQERLGCYNQTDAILIHDDLASYLHKKRSAFVGSVETLDWVDKEQIHCLAQSTHYLKNKTKWIRTYACLDKLDLNPVAALESVSIGLPQIRKDYGVDTLSGLIARLESDPDFLKNGFNKATASLERVAKVDVLKLGKYLRGWGSLRRISPTMRRKAIFMAHHFLRGLRLEIKQVKGTAGLFDQMPDTTFPLDSYSRFVHAIRDKRKEKPNFMRGLTPTKYKLKGGKLHDNYPKEASVEIGNGVAGSPEKTPVDERDPSTPGCGCGDSEDPGRCRPERHTPTDTKDIPTPGVTLGPTAKKREAVAEGSPIGPKKTADSGDPSQDDPQPSMGRKLQ